MSDASTELNLALAVGSDNAADYLKTGLRAALNTLDAQFNALAGHTHSGAHQGGPVGAGGIGPLSVVTGSIADGAVTAAKIADRTLDPFLSAGSFGATAGSPTFADGGFGGHWLLDPAGTEEVSSSWRVPLGFVSGSLVFKLVIAPVASGAAGSREVDLRLTTTNTSPGAVVGGGSATDVVSTNASSAGLTEHTHSRTVAVIAGQLVTVSVARIGGSGTDDLASDLRFYGVAIEYLADS